jgi:hypothetical protein
MNGRVGRPKLSEMGCSTITLSIPEEAKDLLIPLVDEIAKREHTSRSLWIWFQIAEIVAVKWPSNPQLTLTTKNNVNELAYTIQAKMIISDLKGCIQTLKDVRKKRALRLTRQNKTQLDIRKNYVIKKILNLLPKARTLSNKVYPEKFEKLFSSINDEIGEIENE